MKKGKGVLGLGTPYLKIGDALSVAEVGFIPYGEKF